MKCQLCKIKDAEQTGSHITSAFLLTSQIGKRGEERGYLITTNPKQDYSQNQEDSGIKEDYLFCRDCERRLGVVESIYAAEITQKIEQKQFEQNFERTDFKNGYYKLECKKITQIVFQLLIQSNIWRASISNQHVYRHFKLSDNLEERIRSNLDLFLPPVVNHKISLTTKDWIKLTNDCLELFDFIPIVIIKAENIENKEMTYEFFDNLSKIPFHIILNEYFIYVFDESLNWKDDFFELKEEIELNLIINKENHNPIIGVIPNERYFQTIKKIRDLAIEERLLQIEKQCIEEIYRHGIPISPETVRQMIINKVNQKNFKNTAANK